MSRVTLVCKSMTPKDYSDEEILEHVADAKRCLLRKNGAISEAAWLNGYSASALRRRLKQIEYKRKEQPNENR